jgi:hypothetical protein
MRGFFNASSVFLRLPGVSEACEVEIRPAKGKMFADWKVATALPTVKVKKSGFGLTVPPAMTSYWIIRLNWVNLRRSVSRLAACRISLWWQDGFVAI